MIITGMQHFESVCKKKMLHEFKSPDSDLIKVDSNLIEYLENIHAHFECSAIYITSGYRTSDESIRVGGSATDAHTLGMAADVICYANGEPLDGREVCCYAQDIGIGGIGYMGNSVHIDTRAFGGYKNDHWFGDETTGVNVDDFHSYFAIYNEEPAVEEPVVEEPHPLITDYSADIIKAYIEVLHRAPDAQGISDYNNAMNNGLSFDDLKEILKSSAESDDYQKKTFICDNYKALMHRDALPEEIEAWMPYNFDDIFYGIYNSNEAEAIRNND